MRPSFHDGRRGSRYISLLLSDVHHQKPALQSTPKATNCNPIPLITYTSLHPEGRGRGEAYQSSSISAINAVDGHGGLDVARGGSGSVASHGGSSAGEGRGGADAADGLTREHCGRKRKVYRAGDGGGRWDRWGEGQDEVVMGLRKASGFS